MLLVYTLVSLD